MSLATEVASSTIEDIFGAASPLPDYLDGFAPRAGQADMAAAVAAAIDSGENLVVEAGTGVGKTLAYLVPALLSGRRVILSTGTKTLQDQLFHRDLPVVTGALGRPAKVVQLKGRSNYLCLHRLQSAGAESGDAKLRRQLQAIERWSLITRSGDVVEVEGVPEDSPVWPRVTSTQENCLGTKCEFFDQCHVVAARKAAMAADIVVVNHHLLLADMVLKDEGFGELLPGCEAVIIDEAHQFPDIAQSFFNVTISSSGLHALAGDFRAESLAYAPAATQPVAIADGLIKALRDVRLVLPASGNNLLWDGGELPLDQPLDELVAQLDELIVWVTGIGEAETGLMRCRERACAAVERIDSIRGADDAAGLRWLGLSRLGFSLNYTPVDVSGGLRKLIDSQPCAWVFTSATLAIAGNFSHFEMRMGLDEPRSMVVDSPFDYRRAGLLYFPGNMPEPASDNYTRSFVNQLLPLIEASCGRAFLLFTSHRALREAARILREEIGVDYPLLVQGEAPRSKLLDQFVALDNPVLLGTSSFWEGVDIRGDGLVLVAIDKLPFASPGDPMLKARLEAIARNGGQPFRDYQLPQAVLGLKQGVGRLIRATDDSGIVAICDPRISSKGYGRKFLQSLPPFPVTDDEQQAAGFLTSISGPLN